MSTQSSTIVQRAWSYRNALWDDGISSGDYLERRLLVIQEVEPVAQAARLRQMVLKLAFDGKMV